MHIIRIRLMTVHRDGGHPTMNARGEVILSPTPGFNPNVGDTTHWLELERRDPMRSRYLVPTPVLG